jgi:hypothetical protein
LLDVKKLKKVILFKKIKNYLTMMEHTTQEIVNNIENDENKNTGTYNSVLEMLSKKQFTTAGYQIKIPLDHLIYRLKRVLYFLDLNEFEFTQYIYVPNYYNIDLYGYMGDNYSDSDTMLKWFNENNKTIIYNLSKIYVFNNMIIGYMTVNNKSLKIILATSKNKSLLDKQNQFGTGNINLYKGKKYVISSIPLVLTGAIRCCITNKKIINQTF